MRGAQAAKWLWGVAAAIGLTLAAVGHFVFSLPAGWSVALVFGSFFGVFSVGAFALMHEQGAELDVARAKLLQQTEAVRYGLEHYSVEEQRYVTNSRLVVDIWVM